MGGRESPLRRKRGIQVSVKRDRARLEPSGSTGGSTSEKAPISCISTQRRGIRAAGSLGGCLLFLFCVLSLVSAGDKPPQEVGAELPVLEVSGAVHQPPTRFVYSFTWGRLLKVGEIEITAGEILEKQKPERIEVFVRAATGRLTDLFWRYRLNADGFVRLAPFRPGRFEVRESVKRWPKTSHVVFNDSGNEVQTYRMKKGVVKRYAFDVENAWDIPSMLYVLLNQKLELGDTYEVDTLAGVKRYIFSAEVFAHETIHVAGEDRPAIGLRVASHSLTDPDEDVRHGTTEVWVSRDRPRSLLRAVSELKFGAVRFELQSEEAVTGWPFVPEEVDPGLDSEWTDLAEDADPETEGYQRTPELKAAPERG